MKNHKTYTVEEAQRLLENFCSYRERCYREVEQKLKNMCMITKAREKIIIHLLEYDFLNEERFAKSYAGGKFRINRWGKLKIKRALQQKGVSKANIEIGLAEIDDEDYINTLKNLAENKQKLSGGKDSFKERQKLVRFLQQKGYETDLIYRVVIEKNG